MLTSHTAHFRTTASYGDAVALDGYILPGNGGAISILSAYATFTHNSAVTGAAVYAKNDINFLGEPLGHLLLQDVVIKDNHCSGGGAVYFDGMKVDIFGNTPTGSQFSSNSGQGPPFKDKMVYCCCMVASHSQRTEE